MIKKRIIFLLLKGLLRYNKKGQMTIKYGQESMKGQVAEKETKMTSKYE